MTADDYVRGQLVQFAWRIGSEISLPAMVVLLFVVRNRLNQTTDKNWLAVIDKLNGEVGCTSLDPTDVRDPKFIALLDYVDGIYDETKADKWSLGATHFWDGGTPWFDLASKERVGNVGELILFR